MMKYGTWNKSGLVLGILGVALLWVTPLVAQSLCGTIIDVSGNVTGYTDCENPFDAEEGFPFDVMFDDTIIVSDGAYQFNLNTDIEINVSDTGVYNVDGARLFEHEDVNRFEVALTPDEELQDRFVVSFDRPGTYTIVVYGEEEIAYHNASFLARLKALVIPYAYAQSSGQPFVRTFTVIDDTPPPLLCGQIIDQFGEGSDITDCDIPLGTAHPNASLVLTFGDIEIETGSSYEFFNQEHSFGLTGVDPGANGLRKILYHHESENYRIVYQFSDPFSFTATGTYTMVVTEDDLVVSSNFLRTIRDMLVPTAYAALFDQTHITFTVLEASSVPTGASSVLFLPGIQASRLYEKSDEFGIVNQLWIPDINADVEKLAMNDIGESIHDVYTEDIIDEVALPFLGLNIYKGFIAFMDDLVSESTIVDWAPFAYDWRYDVFDIVQNGTQYEDETKYPIAEIERLAANSHSGKVTLIGHSNGGLLIKAIMIELEAQGKIDLIDKVVFIGTPHLGTPKAIATALHGYDQQKLGGFLIDDSTARSVIKNLPGMYSLLPSAAYMDALDQPLIVFDDSDTTQVFRDAYGFGIINVTEFIDFMNGAEDIAGRTDIAFEDVNEPALANATMLQNAFDAHSMLDVWTAPLGTEVHEVVGTGLLTLKGLEYREIIEDVCFFGGGPDSLCPAEPLLKPHARMTKYGDETVMSVSAEGVQGKKGNYYLNLRDLNSDIFFSFNDAYTHANLTEVDEIQELVMGIINNISTQDINYISDIEPVFSDIYDIEEVNSPVRIFAEDIDGNITGMVEEDGQMIQKQDIPGSYYFEFGTTKYLVIPEGTERTTTLTGEEYGGYTLTISSLDADDEQVTRHEISNASSTPDMKAIFSKSSEGYSTITTDLDGDGENDTETTIDGEIVAMEEITYSTLHAAIDDLSLTRSKKRKLQRNARLAEYFGKRDDLWPVFARIETRFLKRLERKIKKYARKGRISVSDRDILVDIIGELRNK